ELSHASAAASRAATVEAALAASGTPGVAATLAGWWCSVNSPPGACRRSGAMRARGSPMRRAAATSASPSPKISSRAPQCFCSARAHSSGPTPAGSPGTSASRRRCISAVADGAGGGADIDIGFAAHFTQEPVPFVLELALADGFTGLVATVFIVDAGLAAADALDDVPAGLAAERCGDFAVLQRRDLLAERRAELVVGEPAKVAAGLAGDGVVGRLARDRGERAAPGHCGMKAVDAGLGGGVIAPDQDVACLVLGDGLAGGGLRAVADVDKLQQLEAAGTARGTEHLAGLEAADDRAERGRDLVDAAPAEIAALERVGAVGVAHCRRREIHLAAFKQALDPFDLLFGHCDLLWRGAVGQCDQDVGEPVLGAAGLAGQCGVDLGVGDHDRALRESLAQALDGELVAQRAAELVVRDAVAGQLLAELVGRHVVLPGDCSGRGVKLFIGHAHAGGLGACGLQLDQDQAL